LFLIGYYASLKTSSFSSEKVSINGWLRNQQWIYFSHFFFSTCLFFFVSSNSGSFSSTVSPLPDAMVGRGRARHANFHLFFLPACHAGQSKGEKPALLRQGCLPARTEAQVAASHKMATDADYRANQHDAQKAWCERNHDYWRLRRLTQRAPPPLPTEPDTSAAHSASVKMDTLTHDFNLFPGRYIITPIDPAGRKIDALRVKIATLSTG
jgi:hypothetical protein